MLLLKNGFVVHVNTINLIIVISCLSKRKAIKDQNVSEFQRISKDYYQKNYSFQYRLDDLTIYDQVYLRMIIEEFTSEKDFLKQMNEIDYEIIKSFIVKGREPEKIINFY